MVVDYRPNPPRDWCGDALVNDRAKSAVRSTLHERQMNRGSLPDQIQTLIP